MEEKKCIVRLSYVPTRIIDNTDGEIDSDMYLLQDAVDSLLRGVMFSGLSCRWGGAAIMTEEVAQQVISQLKQFGIVAVIIRVF